MKSLLLGLALITHTGYAKTDLLSSAKALAFEETQTRLSDEFVKMSDFKEVENADSASVSFVLTDNLKNCVSNVEVSCVTNGDSNFCFSNSTICEDKRFNN